MSDVLEKSKAELTGEDRQTLADYIARYGPILERVNKALSSIEKKLKGVDPEDEYTPSIAEQAQSKLSSVMRQLKTALKRVGWSFSCLNGSTKRKTLITCSWQKRTVPRKWGRWGLLKCRTSARCTWDMSRLFSCPS